MGHVSDTHGGLTMDTSFMLFNRTWFSQNRKCIGVLQDNNPQRLRPGQAQEGISVLAHHERFPSISPKIQQTMAAAAAVMPRSTAVVPAQANQPSRAQPCPAAASGSAAISDGVQQGPAEVRCPVVPGERLPKYMVCSRAGVKRLWEPLIGAEQYRFCNLPCLHCRALKLRPTVK